MTAPRRAAFLDRDGTLIEDAHYLSDAEHVRLLPGVAEPVRRLNEAGVLVIVITNQSGIAQGLLTEAQYEATRERLDVLLAARGARIDASYHCPHHPDVSGPCDCRKPGTELHRRAARDFGLDLAGSLYVGDRLRDVVPGEVLGGTARLVPSASTPPDDFETARSRRLLATSLARVVDHFLHGERGS